MTVFAGVRDPRAGEALTAKGGPSLIPITLDVTDELSIARSLESVHRIVGKRGLAGLVNNAGIVIGSPLEVIPLSQLRKQLEVNVIGQIAVPQAFLPLLCREGYNSALGTLFCIKVCVGSTDRCVENGITTLGDSGVDYRAGGHCDTTLGEISEGGGGS
jgi:NAD(P)-dependent dehydrogenase (short-subunit alcohol dehydrogenase family)